MINALHLLWIIPISLYLGVFVTCLAIIAKDKEK